MLIGALNRSNANTNLGSISNHQSRVFIGADTTARVAGTVESGVGNYTTAAMNPAPFGTGKVLVRDFAMRVPSSFRFGELAWTAACVESAHWTALTINGVAHRVTGVSTTTSHGIETPYRKNGASADTLNIRRTTGTWAAWTDLLQAIWDDIGTNGVYWQQEASA
jgi:hypothetical protein